MKFHNVCSCKTFKKKDGTEKTVWLNCGTMKVTDENKIFLELNMFPSTTFFVFPPKPKEESSEFSD